MSSVAGLISEQLGRCPRAVGMRCRGFGSHTSRVVARRFTIAKPCWLDGFLTHDKIIKLVKLFVKYCTMISPELQHCKNFGLLPAPSLLAERIPLQCYNAHYCRSKPVLTDSLLTDDCK